MLVDDQSAPRGFYLADEVGQLAGVSGDRIGQWARRGYIRSSQSDGSPRIYSFQDVAEAMAVHELIAVHHVDQGVVRRTVEDLRARHKNWPLQATQFELPPAPSPATRQRQLVYRDSQPMDSTGTKGQLILTVGRLRKLALDLSRGGWAVRENPTLRSIIVDPDLMSGRPAIRGRRIVVADVVSIASEPDGHRILRNEFDLTEKQIADALSWWNAAGQFAIAV